MTPEIGTFAIILALCFAFLQAGAAWYEHITLPRAAASGQFIFLCFAMLCLITGFINNDFTVLYIREHSHPTLPLLYRIGAAWGGHEGSLLLWCLILSGWTTAFNIFGKKNSAVLMVLGIISTGFILFLLLTSNPFLRNFPAIPITGNDLMPVLQDPGLIFHPPVLYTGYVGCAIGFAFAVAALYEGKISADWARALRPWVLAPWAFLGCGIVSGSWWAYRELGWGGWWFWDPVENASLLPWLSATALLHSLIVSEKRQTFFGWSILLAIITFTLSLLGTFLVRSGVLVSVHAFASDPTRGIFLLGFLILLIGGSLFLYGIRIAKFYRAVNFSLFSRETFLLGNTILLLTAVVIILTGTLYPIILDALNAGKISVGEPYFNTLFIPLILFLLLLMGAAPHIHWQNAKGPLKKFILPCVISLSGALLFFPVTGFQFYWLTAIGIFFALWVIVATTHLILRSGMRFSRLPMIVAHIGIALLALGITLNKTYNGERQLRMHPGETTLLAGYQFHFVNTEKIMHEKNYTGTRLNFSVANNTVTSEQRIFISNHEAFAHPGILFNLWRDIYIAPGNHFADNSWQVRIYYRPFVRWIWAGGLLTMVGGLLALVTRRKKHEKKS